MNGKTDAHSASRLTSPEQLNDYLRVTNPKIWMLLVAIILIVAGLLLWSSLTEVESYATGTARADHGELAISFDDAAKAQQVRVGMLVEVGDAKAEILSVGTGNNGEIVASAQTSIPDGTYEARVGYKATQIIAMLFN